MLNSKSSLQAVFNTQAAKAFALPSLLDPFFNQYLLAKIPKSY
jgi:hypothetical protein